MNGLIHSSLYFGMLVSVGAYMLGVWLKKKTGCDVNSAAGCTRERDCIYLFFIEYRSITRCVYRLFLTPAVQFIWIPLYKQLELLRQHLIAVASAIVAGVAGSVGSIYVMCRFFQLEHTHYVTLLPKSITTAIGMGVSEEAGGIVTLTVISIIITGILGNIIADWLFRIFKIEEPIAKGLALGTAAHAIGTAKALELGEIEGAMSSLSIAVAGLLTVVVVPLMSGLI